MNEGCVGQSKSVRSAAAMADGKMTATDLAKCIAEFKAFVEKNPGWNSGPQHAKHPIIFVETAVEKALN